MCFVIYSVLSNVTLMFQYYLLILKILSDSLDFFFSYCVCMCLVLILGLTLAQATLDPVAILPLFVYDYIYLFFVGRGMCSIKG